MFEPYFRTQINSRPKKDPFRQTCYAEIYPPIALEPSTKERPIFYKRAIYLLQKNNLSSLNCLTRLSKVTLMHPYILKTLTHQNMTLLVQSVYTTIEW